jgi:hypothetical protein
LAEHPITAFQGEGRKQFIGLARKAGFGGNWDIALDWVKHDLMEPGLLEHLQAGLEATGQKRDFDLGKLASWAADQKEVAAREAVARAQMLIENRMAKWSPELSPLIQRTDPSSRTGVGRVANVFTSYPLALYTHKLLNAQGMPGGKIISLLFAGMMGEMLIGKFREMLNGRSGAEIADEIESDPVKALSVYALRVPWLGNLTPWVEAAVTQLVQPERARTPNPLAGPASAALTSIDHGRRMVAGLFQSEQSANANEERALNAIAGMNWMTHGLYNNALASALGLAEEQEKRLNRRWRSTPEPSRQSPGLLFEDSSDPRKEIRLPTMQTAPEFNLNESLDKE